MAEVKLDQLAQEKSSSDVAKKRWRPLELKQVGAESNFTLLSELKAQDQTVEAIPGRIRPRMVDDHTKDVADGRGSAENGSRSAQF